MSKILDSQLLIYKNNMQTTIEPNILGADNHAKGEFAEKMLLYDRIIIPTFDFSIMPVLMKWLGNDILENLLDSGAISFIRALGYICYRGEVGLVVISGNDQSTIPPRQKWIKAAFGDTGAALDFWIHRAVMKPEPKQRQRIIDMAVSRTHTIGLVRQWLGIVEAETYKDISESSLSKHFPPDIQLDNLPGIRRNEIRTTNLYEPTGDFVDYVLRLAYMNFEIYLAHLAEEADLTSGFDIDLLLRSKAERLQRKIHGFTRSSEAFTNILELNRIPDIASAVATGELGLDEIAEIRSRKSSEDFRRWFHINVVQNPNQAHQEYVQAIDKPGLTDKLPVKIVRFLITASIGRIPVLGDAVSIADSFVLDRFLKGYSPKVFIDELRARLPVDIENTK